MCRENNTYQKFKELSSTDKLRVIDYAENLREVQCNLPR